MMKLLSKLLGHVTHLLPEDQEIRDEQFLDNGGKVHMDTYLSFYEREDAMKSGVSEAAFADTFISSFYSAPVISDERRWEQAHEPSAYAGGLKTFVVRPGIKRIGVKAFSYNINLKDVTLPEGLEIIDREAFSICNSLKQVTIPSTVRRIGKDAFDSRLEQLVLLCETPPEISSLGISKNCSIYVPASKSGLYKSTSHWKKYAGQIRELL